MNSLRLLSVLLVVSSFICLISTPSYVVGQALLDDSLDGIDGPGLDAANLPPTSTLPVDRTVCWPTYSDVGSKGWLRGTCTGPLRVGASCSFACRRGSVISGNPITCVQSAAGPIQQGRQHCVPLCSPLTSAALSRLPAGSTLGTCNQKVRLHDACSITCPRGLVKSGSGYRCAINTINGAVSLVGFETCVPPAQASIDDVQSSSSFRGLSNGVNSLSPRLPTASVVTPGPVSSVASVTNSCINGADVTSSWDNFTFKGKYGFYKYIQPQINKFLAKPGLAIACGEQSGADIKAGKTIYTQMTKKGLTAAPAGADVCRRLPLLPTGSYPLIASTFEGASICLFRSGGETPESVSWGIYVNGSPYSEYLPSPLTSVSQGGFAYAEGRGLVSNDYTTVTFPPDNFVAKSCRNPADARACRGHVWTQLVVNFDLHSIVPPVISSVLTTVKGSFALEMAVTTMMIDLDPDVNSSGEETRQSPFLGLDNIASLDWIKNGLAGHDARDFAVLLGGSLTVGFTLPYLPMISFHLQLVGNLLIQYNTDDLDTNGLSRNGIYIPFTANIHAVLGPQLTKVISWIRTTCFFLPALENLPGGALAFDVPASQFSFWLNTRGAFIQATVAGYGIRIGLSVENPGSSMICFLTDGVTCETRSMLQIIKSIGSKLVINGVAMIGQAIGQTAQMIIDTGLTFIQRLGASIAQVIDNYGRLIGEISSGDFNSNTLNNIKKLTEIPLQLKKSGRIAPEALTPQQFQSLLQESEGFRSFIESEKLENNEYQTIAYVEESSETTADGEDEIASETETETESDAESDAETDSESDSESESDDMSALELDSDDALMDAMLNDDFSYHNQATEEEQLEILKQFNAATFD